MTPPALGEGVDKLLTRLVYKKGDGGLEIMHKKSLLAVFCFVMVFSAVLMGLHQTELGLIGSSVNLVVSIAGVGVLLVMKGVPSPLLEVLSYLIMGAVILKDWEAAANHLPRQWPLAMVLLDALFISEAAQRVSKVVVCLAVVWFLVSAFESAYRLGVFDVSQVISSDRGKMCSCEDLPCGVGSGDMVVQAAAPLAVLLANYCFTWKLADVAKKDRSKISRAVELTDALADSLRMFDLEGASDAVEAAAPNLPEPLINAYRGILEAMEEYKPYLDPACLHDDLASTISRSSALNPTLTQKRLTLVCVNIKHALQMIHSEKERFLYLHRSILDSALSSFESGVIDIFIGDKILASFNASQKCTLHALSAVRGVIRLFGKLALNHLGSVANAGIVGGSAQVGYLGCQQLRRFCTVGKLTSYLTEVERYGRRKRVELLCDRSTALDVGVAIEKRIILEAVRAPVLYCDELLFHYEVICNPHALEEEDESSTSEEWMYRMQGAPGQRWESFNEAGLSFLQNDFDRAARLLDQATPPVETVKSFEEIIRGALSMKEPPLVVTWTTPNSYTDTDPIFTTPGGPNP